MPEDFDILIIGIDPHLERRVSPVHAVWTRASRCLTKHSKPYVIDPGAGSVAVCQSESNITQTASGGSVCSELNLP